jgi:hypothetical protein
VTCHSLVASAICLQWYLVYALYLDRLETWVFFVISFESLHCMELLSEFIHHEQVARRISDYWWLHSFTWIGWSYEKGHVLGSHVVFLSGERLCGQFMQNTAATQCWPWSVHGPALKCVYDTTGSVLLEKLIVRTANRKFIAFYESQSFTIVFWRVRHRSLSWAWWIQCLPFKLIP